ncbi:MAG: type ISP restriction/modification enzyme [Planctomycetota bacterium]
MQGWKLTEVMPVHGVGMTTARDQFVIDMDKEQLVERIHAFKESPLSDDRLHQEFGIRPKKGWNIRKAWNMLQGLSRQDISRLVVSVSYRPFDNRLIFYHDSLVWRTVKKIMQHMLRGDNVGLISARSNKSSEMNHFFCSRFIMETKCGESTTQSCLFPLYLYSTLATFCQIFPLKTRK